MAEQRDTNVVNLHARRSSGASATQRTRGSADAAGSIEIECANSRCDERFRRPTRRTGRPQRYHSPDCRRSAQRDRVALQWHLSILEDQAALLRARLVVYGDSAAEATPEAAERPGPSDREWAEAREAVAAASAVARYLADDPSPAVQDLLQLLRGVEPVIRRRD